MKEIKGPKYAQEQKESSSKSKDNSFILPPHVDRTIRRIPADTKKMLIIGANGTGKTRFANRMMEDFGERGYRLSAVEAIYRGKYNKLFPSGPDVVYTRNFAPESISPESTGFERLLSLLMQDEMANLIKFKLSKTNNPDAKLRHTRLDTVIELWQEVFPDNRVLIDGGKFLFTRSDDFSGYAPVRLSSGEKAVLYYIGAVAFAPSNAVIMVESPELLLHQTVSASLWNRLELLRPDCAFVYITHDVSFASTRTGSRIIWVRDCDNRRQLWNYEIITSRQGIPDEIYLSIVGSRKPVMFIEGDGRNSIDASLYPLIFKEYTVKSLGSCDKVIEATRTFNDLKAFHQLDSCGIVDRDRRDEKEVSYLRSRKILVPEVAEIENMLLLEEVVRAVASHRGRDENRVFQKVKNSILKLFASEYREQALQHTRHRVKRNSEYRIDGKFPTIEALEKHIKDLDRVLAPRNLYNGFITHFETLLREGDYPGVLKVFNFKPMLGQCNVAGLCGLKSVDEYLGEILYILRTDRPAASRIRLAVKDCFLIPRS